MTRFVVGGVYKVEGSDRNLRRVTKFTPDGKFFATEYRLRDNGPWWEQDPDTLRNAETGELVKGGNNKLAEMVGFEPFEGMSASEIHKGEAAWARLSGLVAGPNKVAAKITNAMQAPQPPNQEPEKDPLPSEPAKPFDPFKGMEFEVESGRDWDDASISEEAEWTAGHPLTRFR